MKYLIANTVIYDTESGELTIPGAGLSEGKKLTNTANRILSLLIASPGEVLGRQYLFEQVWESAGHTSSSSSLNQYISILRKTLTSLTDIEESIIVVPKVGFYFSSDIDVQIIETTESISDQKNSTPLPVAMKTLPRRYLWGIMVIIILLLTINIWVWNRNAAHYRYNDLTEIGQLHKCSINTFEHLTSDMRKHLIENVLTSQTDLDALCRTHNAKLMVNIQPSILYGSPGRFFYAYCPLDSENKELIYCDNHYVFNWKVK
jgi:DNA-binding winged helix-turn-helix (wHTH) protein